MRCGISVKQAWVSRHLNCMMQEPVGGKVSNSLTWLCGGKQVTESAGRTSCRRVNEEEKRDTIRVITLFCKANSRKWLQAESEPVCCYLGTQLNSAICPSYHPLTLTKIPKRKQASPSLVLHGPRIKQILVITTKIRFCFDSLSFLCRLMCIWSVSGGVAEFPVPSLTSQLHVERQQGWVGLTLTCSQQ